MLMPAPPLPTLEVGEPLSLEKGAMERNGHIYFSPCELLFLVEGTLGCLIFFLQMKIEDRVCNWP